MRHIICYSGGHSSALVAIEVVRRYGPTDVVLLNHEIHPRVEDPDIKRFKNEVAAYLGLPITYASYADPTMDQFDIALKHSAFKAGGPGTVICTSRLKTEPFEKWLKANCIPEQTTIYYGFDAGEGVRMQRRTSVLGASGYTTAYPLAHWPRTIESTKDIGIEPPLTYGVWKHANCVGCIKAGKQHWYAVYCLRPDIWEKAKHAEQAIGHSILPSDYLEDIEPLFKSMKCAGIAPTEKVPSQTFWASAKKIVKLQIAESDERPCECVF